MVTTNWPSDHRLHAQGASTRSAVLGSGKACYAYAPRESSRVPIWSCQPVQLRKHGRAMVGSWARVRQSDPAPKALLV